MGYQELDKKQGWDYLSNVRNVFIDRSDDVFVTPFGNTELRYRCLFIDKKIYLYLTIDEIEKFKDLNPTPKERGVYFYGTFNLVNVYQVRALCSVKQVQITEEFNSIFRLINNRLLGDKIPSDNFIKHLSSPTEKEKNKAFEYLASPGRFYCFEPSSYAYNKYEID